MIAVNDRLYVRKGIIPERTQGGIIIAAGVATDAKVKLNIGKVLSVGDGIRFSDGYVVKPQCSNGDVIQWESFVDLPSELIGENIVVVRWEDVIGKLEPHEYKGWIFDPEEYRKYTEELNASIEKVKKESEEQAAKNAVEKKIRSCQNRNCIYVTKPIEDKEQCEYCGSVMIEVEEKKGPSIFVRGGASKPRI